MKVAVVSCTLLSLAATPALANDRVPDEREINVIYERSPVLKGVTLTLFGLAAVSMTFTLYAQHAMHSSADDIQASRADGQAGRITQDDCGTGGIVDRNGAFVETCTWRSRSSTAAVLSLGLLSAGAAAAIAYYYFPTKREVPRVTVVPTVTTESAGALVELSF